MTLSEELREIAALTKTDKTEAFKRLEELAQRAEPIGTLPAGSAEVARREMVHPGKHPTRS